MTRADVEVFAELVCLFTRVGLRRATRLAAQADRQLREPKLVRWRRGDRASWEPPRTAANAEAINLRRLGDDGAVELRYDPDVLPLLREMRATWTGPTIGLWDFINYRGSLQIGYGFASLFCPDFMEIDGAVVLAERYDRASFDQWREYFRGDLSRVEAMVNHVHIEDLFTSSPHNVGLEPIVGKRLGEALALCWRATLQERFPERSFTVELDDPGDGVSPVFTFYQDR